MSKKIEIKTYLKEQSFVASKKMGQNFLSNFEIKKRIVDATDARKNDLIIEIGPGLGAITEIILQKNYQLLAIELDKRLHAYLIERYSDFKNFKIINNDFLKLDLNHILFNMGWNNFDQIHVIANLPYSISSKIIIKLLKFEKIQSAVVMVQKEMAQRICSKPKTKDYNSLTVLVGLLFEVKTLFDVGPKNFIPAPKVNSSVIKLTRKEATIHGDELSDLSKFLRNCFLAKRKTLFNNLISICSKDEILKALKTLKLIPTVRAEELAPDVFYQLYKLLS